MPVPISGDKILAQRDSHAPRAEPQDKKPGGEQLTQARPASADSVSLSNAAANEEVRPLSDNIRSAKQARDSLQGLLDGMLKNPQGALNAQGAPSQTQTEALLHAPG